MKIKSIITKITTKKDFSYTKETCSLNFTLNIDNSSELRDFRSCLIAATKDIDKILEGMKN